MNLRGGGHSTVHTVHCKETKKNSSELGKLDSGNEYRMRKMNRNIRMILFYSCFIILPIGPICVCVCICVCVLPILAKSEGGVEFLSNDPFTSCRIKFIIAAYILRNLYLLLHKKSPQTEAT